MRYFERISDFITNVILSNIHLALFIAGIILLAPVTFLVHGMINPMPVVVTHGYYKVLGVQVYANATVMPWIALFFIALINGVSLVISAIIYSDKNIWTNPRMISRDGRACFELI